MADKNSFLLYYDLEEQTKAFSDEQMGKLLRAIFAYEIRGEEVQLDDVLKIAFSFVRVQLREAKKKYEEKCETNRRAAILRHEREKAERQRFEETPLPWDRS